jgi:hypothetical protein
LFTDSLTILARWRKRFSQLLYGLGVSDVRHTEIHTAEVLVPEPSAFGVEMAIEKLKRDILIKTGCRKIRYEVHKLIISVRNKEELPEEWKESVILPIYKKGDTAECGDCTGISLCHLYTKLFPTYCCQG